MSIRIPGELISTHSRNSMGVFKSYVRADIMVSDVAKQIKPVEIETKNFLKMFNRVFLQVLFIKTLLFK
ncbi:MAG: hypothetical protein QW739_04160 [Candidatus Odinarchaeota archaeon]